MASADPWAAPLSTLAITPLSGVAWRVECQGQDNALLDLVDSLQELQALQQLLTPASHSHRTGYPQLRPQAAARDPQLHTVWTTRPWPYGSRFGDPRHNGLLYASLELDTALAEAAHQRARFWQGMCEPPPDQRLRGQHRVYSLAYHCERGVRLQNAPFRKFYPQLTQRDDYQPTQGLGQRLRERSLDGWEAPSCRCPQFGINLVLTHRDTLTSQRPGELQHWISEVTPTGVVWAGAGRLLRFSFDELLS